MLTAQSKLSVFNQRHKLCEKKQTHKAKQSAYSLTTIVLHANRLQIKLTDWLKAHCETNETKKKQKKPLMNINSLFFLFEITTMFFFLFLFMVTAAV